VNTFKGQLSFPGLLEADASASRFFTSSSSEAAALQFKGRYQNKSMGNV